MKKLLLPLALISLSLTSTAQDNVTSTEQRYEIEGLYLGMPKAAATEVLARFCLKTGGEKKEEVIKGDYNIVFSEITRCNFKSGYFNIRSAQDRVYDIAKKQTINVEPTYEHADMLLARAKDIYGEPTLQMNNQNQKYYLAWKMNTTTYSQLPKSFQGDAFSDVSNKGCFTAAFWGDCSTTLDTYRYIIGGDKPLSILFFNDSGLKMLQRSTDIAAIDNAWQAYLTARENQINEEKSANKNIIDAISF